MAPFPLDDLAWLDRPLDRLGAPWHAFVVWCGEQVFHLGRIEAGGGSDRPYAYVEVFCLALVSLVAAAAWSALFARRLPLPLAHRWLRAFLRYALATTMFVYAVWKILPQQFPFPHLSRWVIPFANNSPRGLLWAFMGYSRAYSFLAGCLEMAGALLICFRRTTPAGALLLVGVLAQVTLLNYCYDIDLKLFTTHLLLIAIFLIAPDLRRLADLLLFNRAAPAVELQPLFRSIRARAVAGALVFAFLAWMLAQDVLHSVRFIGRINPPRPALYGIYRVESAAGDAAPPWSQLVIDAGRTTSGDWLEVERADGTWKHYDFRAATDGSINLGDAGGFTVSREGDFFRLRGRVERAELSLRLARIDERQLPILKHEFRWMSER